jgi:hypothetical protein
VAIFSPPCCAVKLFATVSLYTFLVCPFHRFIASSCLSLPCRAFPCLSLPFLAFPCLSLPLLAAPCLSLPFLAFPCLSLPFLALPLVAQRLLVRPRVPEYFVLLGESVATCSSPPLKGGPWQGFHCILTCCLSCLTLSSLSLHCRSCPTVCPLSLIIFGVDVSLADASFHAFHTLLAIDRCCTIVTHFSACIIFSTMYACAFEQYWICLTCTRAVHKQSFVGCQCVSSNNSYICSYCRADAWWQCVWSRFIPHVSALSLRLMLVLAAYQEPPRGWLSFTIQLEKEQPG